QEACWVADAALEGVREAAAAQLRRDQARLAAPLEQLQTLAGEARALLGQWRQPLDDFEQEARRPSPDTQPPLRKLAECVEDVTDRLQALRSLRLPRLRRGRRLLGLTVLLGLLLVFP